MIYDTDQQLLHSERYKLSKFIMYRIRCPPNYFKRVLLRLKFRLVIGLVSWYHLLPNMSTAADFRTLQGVLVLHQIAFKHLRFFVLIVSITYTDLLLCSRFHIQLTLDFFTSICHGPSVMTC